MKKEAPFIFWVNESITSMKPLLTSLLLTGFFFLLSFFCLIISDKITLEHSISLEQYEVIQSFKGSIYVFIISVFCFLVTYLLLKRDEKTRMKLNQQLIYKERQAMGGLIASSVSHDVNNLMTIIVGNLSLIKDSIKDKSLSKYLEPMNEASDRLINLNRKLIISGKSNYSGDFIETSINEIIKNQLLITHNISKIKKCDVTFNSSSDCIIVAVQPQLLSRAIFNLLINAADATNNIGKIEILLFEKENSFFIEVHDNGSGISDETKGKIFEPFYTTKKSGSGLGLISVDLCVKEHGGKIEIKDSHLGGANFKIEIPNNIKKDND